MTKTDIGIYRGLKEKFDPEVHVGFFITTDTGELLLGDQSLGQTISGWEINDGVLILKLNTGKDIRVTFPEATETVKGLLSAADKAQLNALQANLDSKVDKVTGKSLLADSEIEKLAGLPNSTELTNSIATAKAAGDNAQSDLNAHKQNKSNPHEVTKAQIGLGNVTNDAQVKRSEMGVANGVATLDADGKVPASQLPSYVDDIIDVYATYSKSDTGVLSDVTLYLDAAHTQLVTGEAGKIYQNIADGEPQYQFRWTGTIFSQTGASSLILGEVTGTAYDGAKGKANADNIAKIKGTSLSHIKDAAPITTAADKVSLNYECFEGNQYGAAGTAHTADIPAATTAKAGVMSAADKTKLENLNSKLVVADEEDVTAVDGKIKFKDRDTTNGMGYKILRLPENGILTQDMINDPNTIYEIRYNFDLNGATINIPENCTLKFEGGTLSNGLIAGNVVSIQALKALIFNNIQLGVTSLGLLHSKWFGAVGDSITDDTQALQNAINSACTSSSHLIIDSGYYKITDSLILNNFIYIEGEGEKGYHTGGTVSGSHITQSTEGKDIFLLTEQNYGTTIKKLRLSGTRYAINSSDDVGISEGVIEDIHFHGGFKTCINLKGLSISTISNCDFSNNEVGICISRLSAVTIKDNNFWNNSVADIIINSWTCGRILNNWFEKSIETGTHILIEPRSATLDTIFDKNSFTFPRNVSAITINGADNTTDYINLNNLGFTNCTFINTSKGLSPVAPIKVTMGSNTHSLNSNKVYFDRCTFSGIKSYILNTDYSGLYWNFTNCNFWNEYGYSNIEQIISDTTKGKNVSFVRTNHSGIYTSRGIILEPTSNVVDNTLFIDSSNDLAIRKQSESFKLQIIRHGNTEDRVDMNSSLVGSIYFDKTLNRPVYWNGTKWVDPAEDSIKWRTIE